MKALIFLCVVTGAALVYLMSEASSNNAVFAQNYKLLFYLGLGLALGLGSLIVYQLLLLRRKLRERVFGSKLTLRLMVVFALMALIPGGLVYAISFQFLQQSIESWFNVRVDESLNRGVPLYLVVDFELSRPRWYWFDEKPIQLAQTYRISYTPLLRQYRLSMGSAYQNFTRFDEVTRVLSRVRAWHVADKGAVKVDGPYQASLRMRLDTAQLPKPFQLNAIASRDWAPASEWYRWSIGNR